MPSVSSKQERFMRAVAHDKGFAEKVGVSQSVGKDFEDADEKEKLGKKKPRHERMYKEKEKS